MALLRSKDQAEYDIMTAVIRRAIDLDIERMDGFAHRIANEVARRF